MVLILLLLLSAGLEGQFFEYGQDAGRLKWYQFKTPNYTVIHPAGVDSLARAFAFKLEHYYPNLGEALDHRHSHMPVVIHNESSFSNGVFVWAPKRLEIFTNPDPNGYYQDWLTQLALHEGRHAVQIDKLNQGLTRGLSILGGQQVVGAMAVFLPFWYLEGDAVDSETRLSYTGRGRQPSFEMELKAQMLDADRIWSFSKATMGSYRHHIPDHYQLGYLMVRHGRRKYGNQFWVDFQQYAARRPYLLNPTYFSMKKYGLRSKNEFYREALTEYRDHWQLMAEDRTLTNFTRWSNQNLRHFTNYRFPHQVSPTMLLALKTSIDQIPELVYLGDQGQEQRIFRPGFLNSGRISYSRNYVVWDEFVPDVRWSNRNYSIIRRLDLGTGEVKNLGRRTRFFSPALSHDGERVAAIEQTATQHFNLVILRGDGSIERKVPSPGNRFLQQPAWTDADSAVVMLVSTPSGKSLYRYSLMSKQWKSLFDAGADDISTPVVKGNKIYFRATFSGIDNIYCFEGDQEEVYQLTSAPFGAFYPQISADGESLVYSNYTSGGFEAVSMPLDQGVWTSLEDARNHDEQIDYEQTAAEMELLSRPEQGDTLEIRSGRYYKILHLFNFHSWLPLYFDYLNPTLDLIPEHLPVSPGVSLISQNRLSTAVSQLGYEYRDGFHYFHSGIKLKGRYPVLNLYFDYGGDSDVLSFAPGDSILDVPSDLGITAQTYIPFRLNTGKYLTLIQPRIDYNYRRDIQYDEGLGDYRTGAHYLYYSLYATSYLRKGARDILPRTGGTFSAGYYHAPFNHQVFGAVASGGLTVYLPGPLKHQSFRLTMVHQKQYPVDMSHPAFINLISPPRGIHGVFGEVLTRYSADWVFPVLYPDLEIGSLLYLKRIRGALWTDYMTGKNVIVRTPNPHYEDRVYQTAGVDLVVDVNILRIPFPLSLGGRLIYEPATGNVGLEGIFSVELN